MFWVFVKEVKKTKQLHFDRFNEGFYGLTKVTFHFVVDSKDFRFKNLSPRFFKGWP
jgi:hypothetical protein